MNPLPKGSPIIKIDFSPPKPEPQPPVTEHRRWPLRDWVLFIALVFVAHVAFVFVFGEHAPAPVRPVKDVPRLQLADNGSELIALDDPTLFVVPRSGDFVALPTPSIEPPDFRWTEAPRMLSLPAATLGTAFKGFMQTQPFAAYPLDFKPQPELSASTISLQPAFAEHSLLQIEGDVARRRLLDEMVLPDLGYADVLGPSKIQVLVSAAGKVVSAVLLEPSGWAVADERALQLARSARFEPSARLAVGQMIFNWHTVAPTATPTPAE
jgi:TonB family protein